MIKKLKFFYKTKQLTLKTPERQSQLIWNKNMSHDKEVGEIFSAIISLVNNQHSCLVESLGVITVMFVQKRLVK